MILNGLSLCILDFGAVGDGIQDDTDAFVSAIEQIEKNGGGQLIVSGSRHVEAVYRIRPINLTSHMEFYVEAGARIQGIANASLWPILPGLPSYGQGRDHPGPRHTSLIHGENLTNLTIRGQDSSTSIIDGQGIYWWQRFQQKSETYTRGSLIEILYSTHLSIYNIRLKNSPFWTIHPYDCEDVHIRNVHIQNPLHSPNTDGFDPDSSRYVVIEDSTYSGGDDCVAIKSGWDCFGIEYGRPSTYIHLRNLTCWVGQIAIGSEVSGGIEHVWGEQIYFPAQAWHAVKLKTGKTRGGYMRNITFRDIHVTGNLQSSALDINTTLYSSTTGRNPSCPVDWIPPNETIVEYLQFMNWDGRTSNFSGTSTFSLVGMSIENPIRNVVLRDLYFPDQNDTTSSSSSCWICSNIINVSAVNGTIAPWPPCDAIQVVNATMETSVMSLAPWNQAISTPSRYFEGNIADRNQWACLLMMMLSTLLLLGKYYKLFCISSRR